MTESAQANAASVKKTIYDFFRFQIEIKAQARDLFTGADGRELNAKSEHYPTVWHEYVHYLQNIGTTVGVRIFLRWLTALTQFSAYVHDVPTLLVPLYKVPNEPISKEIRDIVAEMQRLVAFRPLDPNPPRNAVPFEPYLDPTDSTHAYLCVHNGTSNIGVPLYGNAFIEGMTQAVEWLSKGKGRWDSAYLSDRSVAGSTTYYDTLVRYFLHHAPKVNPCIPTVLLAHAALQSGQPAKYFYESHYQGMPRAVASATMPEFARVLASDINVTRGIAAAVSELDGFEQDNKSREGTPLHRMLLAGTSLMRRALAAYKPDGVYAALCQPDDNAMGLLIEHFGCPPLYTKDIDTAWGANLSSDLHQLFFLFSAMCDLVFDAYEDGFTRECGMLRVRYCTFRKDSKRYCHGNRLDFEEVGGAWCVMGQAAQYLSLQHKPLTRIG